MFKFRFFRKIKVFLKKTFAPAKPVETHTTNPDPPLVTPPVTPPAPTPASEPAYIQEETETTYEVPLIPSAPVALAPPETVRPMKIKPATHHHNVDKYRKNRRMYRRKYHSNPQGSALREFVLNVLGPRTSTFRTL